MLTGKPGEHFPVREKSGNFEVGILSQNTLYWKIQDIFNFIFCDLICKEILLFFLFL